MYHFMNVINLYCKEEELTINTFITVLKKLPPKMKVLFFNDTNAYFTYQPIDEECTITNYDRFKYFGDNFGMNMVKIDLLSLDVQTLINTLQLFPQKSIVKLYINKKEDFNGEGYIHIDEQSNTCCIDCDNWAIFYERVFGEEFHSLFKDLNNDTWNYESNFDWDDFDDFCDQN